MTKVLNRFCEALEGRSLFSAVPITYQMDVAHIMHESTILHAATPAKVIHSQPPTHLTASNEEWLYVHGAGSDGTAEWESSVTIKFTPGIVPTGDVLDGYIVNIVYKGKVVGIFAEHPTTAFTISGFVSGGEYSILMYTVASNPKLNYSNFDQSGSAGVGFKAI